MKLKDVNFRGVNGCSTTTAHGLSKQIIDEMLRIKSDCLVDFVKAGLNVSIDQQQFALLQPAAVTALAQVIKAHGGQRLVINSAYRTIAQQYLLFRQKEQGLCGVTRAAQPGNSNHESGLALDVRDFNAWQVAFSVHGWKWFGMGDKWHFDYVGAGRNNIKGLSVLAFQRLWNKHNQNDLIKDDGGYGAQTAIRLANSPTEGFGGREEATGNRILRLSQPLMQGDDVRRVQLALQKIGFQLANGADGFYGESTENAVRQFQQQQGLEEVDGRVGPTTLAKLEVANSRQPVIITPRSVVPTPHSQNDATAKFTITVVSKMFFDARSSNIQAHLPNVLTALKSQNLSDRNMILMALATIRAETAGFVPISEGQSRFNTARGGPPFGLYDHILT